MLKFLFAFALTALCIPSFPVYAQTVHEAPISGAVAMTVGTSYPARRAVSAVCTVAGNMTVTFVDASSFVVPVIVGYNVFPFAVTAVSASTATCTYAGLR